MAETIHVRGEGGAIFAMDLPLSEGIQQRLEQGLIQRVNPDGSPFQAIPSAPADEREEGDGEDKGGSDLTAGRSPRPGVNAPKAEWIAYVVSQGLLSADDAANYTKADLIEMVS
ncbi:hypothetical protein PV392_08150 [Streptomyces sp. ME03-5709C]|nr:hypothetical protein [Streptomyces sp. ME03-5709C]